MRVLKQQVQNAQNTTPLNNNNKPHHSATRRSREEASDQKKTTPAQKKNEGEEQEVDWEEFGYYFFRMPGSRIGIYDSIWDKSNKRFHPVEYAPFVLAHYICVPNACYFNEVVTENKLLRSFVPEGMPSLDELKEIFLQKGIIRPANDAQQDLILQCLREAVADHTEGLIKNKEITFKSRAAKAAFTDEHLERAMNYHANFKKHFYIICGNVGKRLIAAA